MLGNIWLSSALIVTAIYSASSVYKSYSDTQEAKQIQENYQIISDIKTLLAEQYNKNPDEVTRDEIIAHLPSGGNWGKVLLLNRNENSTLKDDSFVNENGNFEISEDEKLKLLALKSKLKNIINTSSMTVDSSTKKYTFESGDLEKNVVLNDVEIEKKINRAIHFLGIDLLYSIPTPALDATLTNIIEEFTPYNNMYQDYRTTAEVADGTTLSDTVLKSRKQAYFKTKIKEKLLKNETAIETRLYLLLKDEL